jgi:lantibiotic modifying enzyme
LLALQELVGESDLQRLAVGLGRQLIRTAVHQGGRCSWKSDQFPKQRHLTGLSHGTAGIALALLELLAATGEECWRQHAEAAFNYEQHCFAPEVGNWPDFRGVPSGGGPGRCPLEYSAFWCHGAGGIALSRVRAWELLQRDRYREEASTALYTTGAYTEQMLMNKNVQFVLCHGLAGNAEILLHGCRRLKDVNGRGRALARGVAMAGIQRYSDKGKNWPAQSPGCPAFMVGLAGIGYFYLQMINASLPSFLAVNRQAIRSRFQKSLSDIEVTRSAVV